jgi:hypothetical protein
MIRIAPVLLVLALASTAGAQGKAPSPAGEWTFKSSVMPDDCVVSGDMSVRKAASGFTCVFTASWACKAGAPPTTINTQQSCTATQKGADITISSKLDKVTSTKPAGMEKQMLSGYLADNFNVTINASGDEMEGTSFDPANQARVKFQRRSQLTS